MVRHRSPGERRTLFIKRAAASVAGGIQPGMLARALTGDLFDSGLAARLLLASPPRQPKRWTECEVDPATERIYHDLLDNLLALDFADLDGKPVPLVLRLSDEAKKTWVAFYNVWADEQAAAEGELASAYSKLEGYAARFALIHHVSGHAAHKSEDTAPIRAESIEAGITLSRWFANEARRIYSTLTESTQEWEQRQLMDFIRGRGGSITVRQLQKSNSRKYPDRATAEQALSDLAEAGLGDWQEGPAPERGGHKIQTLILRPTPDASDTRSDSDEGEDAEPSDTRSDTRLGTPAKQGKNGRVSEVSGVGTGNKDADAAKKGQEDETECRGECRQREPGEEG